jgi:hypothetical protein
MSRCFSGSRNRGSCFSLLFSSSSRDISRCFIGSHSRGSCSCLLFSSSRDVSRCFSRSRSWGELLQPPSLAAAAAIWGAASAASLAAAAVWVLLQPSLLQQLLHYRGRQPLISCSGTVPPLQKYCTSIQYPVQFSGIVVQYGMQLEKGREL